MIYNELSRRNFLTGTAAASLAASAGFSVQASPNQIALPPKGKAEHCIMVWLGGGQGQIDTWDPKPKGDAKENKAGSYYDSIPTAIKDVEVCEHLSQCANVLDRFIPLRTVWHDVIDEHAAATNRMHTGRPTSGTIVYPSIGSLVAHELGGDNNSVPPYVVIGYPNASRGPGYLGARDSFLYLTDTESGPAALARSLDISADRQTRRDQLLTFVRKQYLDRNQQDKIVQNYDETSETASRLSGPEFMKVFELDKESSTLRQSYGDEFGQRCLLARRLVQSGVKFIEVSHNLNFVNGTGWDVHKEGILNQHLLIQELDRALATLVTDLEQHKLLDKTLIVVSTEFGRPGGFDAAGGRGHQGSAFSVVLAGGGLNTGQAIGTTDEISKNSVDVRVSIPDLFATMCWCLGIDPHKELYDGERPVPLTDGGNPIAQLFT
ncbi:MAG: hypothetical protein COA78_26495 [Blastopirellula sp.]|nr:MAG: hypothetical protein COA78_26495 [Blastopirellula sp.]